MRRSKHGGRVRERGARTVGIWAALTLLASACGDPGSEPDPDAGAASSDEGADGDTEWGGGSDDEAGRDAGEGGLADACRALFITDDEVDDCIGHARGSGGDPLGLVEACAPLIADSDRLACIVAAGDAAWPAQALVSGCQAVTDSEFDWLNCVRICTQAPWDASALPTTCTEVLADPSEAGRCTTNACAADFDPGGAIIACGDILPAAEVSRCVSAVSWAGWDPAALPQACAEVFDVASEIAWCVETAARAPTDVVSAVRDCAAAPSPLQCVNGVGA